MPFKSYPAEIKKQIIDNIQVHGKTVSDMAREYNLSSKTIYNWIRKDTQTNGGSDTASLEKEVTRLKREKEQYLSIIGELTVQIERFKKKIDI